MDYRKWVETALRPETEDRVQAMFTSVARRYDLANSLMSFGMHYPWKRFTANETKLKEGGRALDVCAGTCDIALLLAQKVGPTGQVVALDFNDDMLSVGREKIKKAGLDDRVIFVRQNAEDPQFAPETFDAITVSVASRHLDVAKAYANWHKLLKPGGRVVCLDFFEPPNVVFKRVYGFYADRILPRIGTWTTGDRTGVYYYLHKSVELFFTPEEYGQIMTDAGFKNVRYTSLTGGIVCVHTGDKTI